MNLSKLSKYLLTFLELNTLLFSILFLLIYIHESATYNYFQQELNSLSSGVSNLSSIINSSSAHMPTRNTLISSPQDQLKSVYKETLELSDSLEKSWYYSWAVFQFPHSSIDQPFDALTDNLEEMLLEENSQDYNSQDVTLIYGQLNTFTSAFFIFFEKASHLLLFYFLSFLLVFLVLLFFMYHTITNLLQKSIDYLSFSFYEINHGNYEKASLVLPKYGQIFLEDKKITSLVENTIDENHLSARVKNMVVNTYDMDVMLGQLFEILHDTLDINRIGICFVDYNHKTFIAESGVADYPSMDLTVGYSVPFENTSLTGIIHSKKGFINNDIESSLAYHPSSPSLNLISKEGIKSNMAIPLLLNNEVFGIIFFSSIHKMHFNQYHLHLATVIINDLSGFFNRSYLLKVVFSRFTYSFSQLANERDGETGDHLQRMTRYSSLLARKVAEANLDQRSLSRNYILAIERYAGLHDIGKVGIPDAILKKPGRLTPDERIIMETHVNIGRHIFQELREGLKLFNKDFFAVAENIIAFHHEHWDGKGYPYKLSGLDIPIEARIIAIADVFDALTSDRVYKKKMSVDQALQIIKDSRGKAFDPVLVDIFLDNLTYITQDIPSDL